MICYYYFPRRTFETDFKGLVAKVVGNINSLPLNVSSKLKRGQKKDFNSTKLDPPARQMLKNVSTWIAKESKEASRIQVDKEYYPLHQSKASRDISYDGGWELKDDVLWSHTRAALYRLLAKVTQGVGIHIADGYEVVKSLSTEEVIAVLELERQTLSEQIDTQFQQMALSYAQSESEERIFVEASTAGEAAWDTHCITAAEKEFIAHLEQVRFKKDKPRGAYQNLFASPEMQAKRVITNESYSCQVCNGGDTTEQNSIVFCSRCSVTVHQKCYGIVEIPNNEWICHLCSEFKEYGRYMKCCLCTRRGGVMCPTTSPASSDFLKKHNQHFREKATRRGKATAAEEGPCPAIPCGPMEVDTERYQEFYEQLHYNYFKEPHEYTSTSVLT